jgi:protein gp37
MECTLIQWAHHTFNPWFGCTEVGPECVNCYARVLMAERLKRCSWGRGAERVLTRAEAWKEPLRWNRKAKQAGERHRVFCASLADVFDEEVPDAWRDRLFEEVIMPSTSLDWLLLTKRPVKARNYLARFECPTSGKLPQNWWIGVSVGVQESDWRLDVLGNIPARIRFVSAEPLLGPLDLRPWLLNGTVNWVIAGGESFQIRHEPRAMQADWLRSLRDQCRDASRSFFFKQWGAFNEAGEYVGKRHIPPVIDSAEWLQVPA